MGYFHGAMYFDGATVTTAGDVDLYLAKYTPGGAFLWARSLGGTGGEEPGDIAVDAEDAIYATGGFGGTANFGDGPVTSAGSLDIFVTKYTAAGDFVRSWVFPDSGGDGFGADIAVDGAGAVWITGRVQGPVDFGDGLLSGDGSYDAFLAGLSREGAHLWSARYGGSGNDVGSGLAAWGEDGVVATGAFTGMVDFGGEILGNAGATEMYLIRVQLGL